MLQIKELDYLTELSDQEIQTLTGGEGIGNTISTMQRNRISYGYRGANEYYRQAGAKNHGQVASNTAHYHNGPE